MSKTRATIKAFILFEISEIGHWILFVIWFLRFVISSLAKKLVLECFYRVWQNLTRQVLKNSTFLLFFLLIGSSTINLSCSIFAKKKSNTDFDEWVEHPQVVLALSKAVLEGMRHLMEVILISEAWFDDMDISIVSDDAEILNVKVTHFTLNERPTRTIFSRWRIFRVSFDNFEYTNTITFDNSNNRHEQSASPDSLFIDIYEPSSKFYLMNNKELAGIEVIYWRDVSRRDRVVTLRMNMDSEKKYIVSYPDLSAN